MSEPREPGAGREELVAQLYDLFCIGGYEGVSLSDISAATGLGRSSLYHHFPGGKIDMATAVIGLVDLWIDERIADLGARDRPLAERIDAMIRSVDEVYEGGQKPCVIASLLIGATTPEIRSRLSLALSRWQVALARALAEAGVPEAEAESRAIDALCRIQGALVLARATGDPGPFRRQMALTRAGLLGA